MYPIVNSVDFGIWVQSERSKRDWSQSDLSRFSGLHRAVISKIEGGTRPMPETLIALSQAFKMSPVTIFRRAGLLPNNENGDQVKFEDWEYLLKQMSPEDEAELRQIAELKIERRKKEGALKTLKLKKERK